MQRPVLAVILCSLALVPTKHLSAQVQGATLTATVTAYETGEPIHGATIRIDERAKIALTDAQGRVQITGIEPGQRIVEVIALGYMNEVVMIDFTPGARVDAEFDLLDEFIELDPIIVQVRGAEQRLRNRGFYERQRYYANGIFLGPEQVAERAATGSRFIDLLRTMRGLRVVPIADKTRSGYIVVSGRGAVSLDPKAAPCQPTIFLDRMRITPVDAFEIENLIPLDQVAGLEVYTGMSIPPEYAGYGVCGVIVVWTY